MRISRDELVLVGIDLVLEMEETGPSYSKEDLALTLDITKKTLNDYFTKLKKADLIETVQKKYVNDISSIVAITPSGRERLEHLWASIDRFILTPEHHNIPSIVNVKTILDRMRDPLEKLFFLSVYSYNKEFDLMTFLDILKISISDSNLVNIFSEMDLDEDDTSANVPFIVSFSRTSFHGGYSKKLLDENIPTEQDPHSMLVIAETDLRQGRLSDAKGLYEFLLSDRFKLTQNQWFLARNGVFNVLCYKGDTEEAMEFMDRTMELTDNKVFIAYCKQNKAKVYSIIGDLDTSLSLYNSAIKSFHSYGLPMMLAIVYNNRGTLYYRLAVRKIDVEKNLQNAEEDWKKARRYAGEARSDYCEATILVNLADLSGMKGDYETAFNYLKKSKKIYEKFGDLEGVALNHFNQALVYMYKKDLDNAIKNFNISMTIANPLPSPMSKEEWKNHFIQYSKDNGFSEIETMI